MSLGQISKCFFKNLRIVQGQLLLKGILNLFQNDKLMEPLSKLDTLENVSNLYFSWFRRSNNMKHFIHK